MLFGRIIGLGRLNYIGVKAIYAVLNIKAVGNSVIRRGIAARALTVEALLAGEPGFKRNDIAVCRYRRLKLTAGNEARFDIHRQRIFRPFAESEHFTHPVHALRCRNIRSRHAANAEHGNLLLQKAAAEGDVCGDDALALNVKPVNIRRGVCFGIAQLLRKLQHLGKIAALGVHCVEDEIRCTVHDAGKGGDLVKAHDALKIMQPRNAAADGGGTAEGDTAFLCKLRQLAVVMRNKVLVCRDYIFACPHRSRHIVKSRAQSAHDLHDRVHALII